MISKRSPLTGSLLLAVAAVALLLAPAASSAAKSHRPGRIVSARATGQISGQAGTIGKATAHCPRGTKVISGGVKAFANIHLDGPARALIPYVSRRKGPHAWTVSVYSVGEPIVTPKRFAAIAYCRKGAGRVVPKSRRTSVTVSANGGKGVFPLGSAFAGCPYGTWPVAGGYSIRLTAADRTQLGTDGSPPGLVFGSRIVAGGWEVTVGRFSTGTSVVRSYAYCGKHPVKIRSRSYYLTGLGTTRHFATPPCPRGTRAVAAGFYAPLIFRSENNISAIIPLELQRLSPRRWRVGAVPISPSPSRSTGATYCSA